MSTASALSFTIIDAPVLDSGSLTNLPDGRVQFSISVPGAATATVLGSTNVLNWDILQSVPLIGGSADDSSTNFTTRFYRLSVP